MPFAAILVLAQSPVNRHSSERAGALDGVDFRRDILPKLQGLPVRVIAEAMGATISHGSKVRSGHTVPHKRHWKALIRTMDDP
jgi:hypothetical protein